MIPIRDHNPSNSKPVVTYMLIAVNVAIFAYMIFLPDGALLRFINTYSLRPYDLTTGQGLYTIITAMFLHGSLGHIFGNMLFLNIFGDNLEATLGRFRYLIFYLICGIAAALGQTLVDPFSTVPNLGASGAIAGIMGGYLYLFPRNRVDILFPVGFFPFIFSVPAYTMILFWFVAQLLSGVGQIFIPEGGGIAYFAHLGGFLTGLLLVALLKSLRQTRPSGYRLVGS